MSWQTICKIHDILPNGGVCALVDEQQVAIFRIPTNNTETLYAISNYDPFSKANVLSRGLVGCNKGEVIVASPIYKNLFNLSNGRCLDDESVTLKTWKVQCQGDLIQIETSQTHAA